MIEILIHVQMGIRIILVGSVDLGLNKTEKIGGLIVYTEVINDQIERELELEKSKKTLQDIMDSLPIGIASHKLASNLDFEYMNEVYPNAFGTTRALIKEKRLLGSSL